MTTLSCQCGETRLTLSGPPILAVDCCCTSCRSAATRLGALEGAPNIAGPFGETHFVLYRKDRVKLPATAAMRAFRLTPESATRRVLAPCCATPLFLEFDGGHWLSLYGSLWPAGTAPKPELRTMTGDLPDPTVLPLDVPNARSHSVRFMWKLLTAWIAMGFRAPKLEIRGRVEA